MPSKIRLDDIIIRSVSHVCGSGPPRLKEAIHYALFPGGGRVRPRLCLAVYNALGGKNETVAHAAAASLEMIHSASLVHDDLPCFDDAALRRGKPALHRVYGEELAVLVGDALIIGATQTLARGCAAEPAALPALIQEISRAAGAAEGLVAGQSMEADPDRDLETIHLAKTAALFEAATVMGALSAGEDPAPWRPVGLRIGHAYQVADDLLDAFGTAEHAGKTVGQDMRNGRPSAADWYRANGALDRLDTLIQSSIDALPGCGGRGDLVNLIRKIGNRLCPPGLRAKMVKKAGSTLSTKRREPEELIAL